MAISEMGFCEPGEINDFVADGNLQWPDGRLPINTSGGNLGEAYIHGFGNVVEAVRQVRGESTCQVAGVRAEPVGLGSGLRAGQRRACSGRRDVGALPADWGVPELTETNRAWFTSGALAVQQCTSCSTLIHPPEEVCHTAARCRSTRSVVAPRGTVHSYTVVHYAANRALADAVPYTVVLVSLDDAPAPQDRRQHRGSGPHRDGRRRRIGKSASPTTARSCCSRSGGPPGERLHCAPPGGTGRLRVRHPSHRPLVGRTEDGGAAASALLRALRPDHHDRGRQGDTTDRGIRLWVRVAVRSRRRVHPLRRHRSRASRGRCRESAVRVVLLAGRHARLPARHVRDRTAERWITRLPRGDGLQRALGRGLRRARRAPDRVQP